MPLEFLIALPSWVIDFLSHSPVVFPTMEDRMRLVLALARENVLKRTGGPFGAGVFDSGGRLIAPGINLVESGRSSVLHAEIIAIALAQKKLDRYDISSGGQYHFELVASTEPCAMCFGAVPWSGVSRLVCGARDADARAIGFDEGPKLDDWQGALEKRGIEVLRDVLRAECIDVLNLYIQAGGAVYNARGGPIKATGKK